MSRDFSILFQDQAQFRRHDEPIRLVSRLNGSRSFRVGELYRAGQTLFEPDAVYGIDRDGHALSLFEPEPSGERIAEVARGPMELALLHESPLIIVLHRFGCDSEWSSIPYSWPLRNLRRAVQIVPPARLPDQGGALLWVSLVDSENGIILGQRGVPMARRFTQALHTAIRDQAREPFVPDAYVEAIRSIYESPADPEGLVARASVRMRFDGSCMID